MKNLNISKKASYFTLGSSIFLAILLLSMTYLGVWRMRYITVGDKQAGYAQIFADFIARQLDEETQNLRAYASSPWWQEAVQKVSAKYSTMTPKAVSEYMAEMDQRWTKAPAEAPLIADVLNSPLGQRLKAIADVETDIAEIFVTDRYGGLAAASERTSDYYQADEFWWQRAYNNGRGNTFLGDVEFDQSSKRMSISLAAPIRDADGMIIGICKMVLDVTDFFKHLDKYSSGRTGHLSLVDRAGNIIFQGTVRPLSQRFTRAEDWDRLLKKPLRYMVLPQGPGRKEFLTAFAEVSDPLFIANNIRWLIIVSQSRDEVFAPQNHLFLGMGFLTIVLVSLIAWGIRWLIGKIFIYPIMLIQQGASHLAKGQLDQKIAVRTGDELESLADSLNSMSEILKQTMVSRDSLEQEINERKKLEETAKQRLKELEVFYKASMGREERILELKKEIEQLKKVLGNNPS